MPVMFEMTDLNSSQVFHTGSVYTSAHIGAAVQGMHIVAMATASWHGLASTWGVDTGAVDQLISSSGGVINAGVWQGIAYSYDVVPLPTESIDRFSFTNEANPSVNQGVSAGEWEPFPPPPSPPEPEAKVRDITRYTKTYSSQRLQVQRIRYTRKRTVT